MKRIIFLLFTAVWFAGCEQRPADQGAVLPSWNDGAAKEAIIGFVKATTTPGSPDFVPESDRVATFDQDGTLWVEQPLYSQLVYCFNQVPSLVKAHPELAGKEPYKTILSGDKEAISKLPAKEVEEMAAATLSGMSDSAFTGSVKEWLSGSQNHRWHRRFTELVYQPMLELMAYLRANGFKTYIVTGGGQDFVRTYANEVYGVPSEQVIGSAMVTRFEYDSTGETRLIRMPELLLNNNGPGKVEGIHFMIGKRPLMAVGNTPGDQEMLEYTKAGSGKRLAMLVLHDDSIREYAYGPANGLPDAKVGSFPQELYDKAEHSGWIVISMKTDWKQIFPFTENNNQ